MGLRVVIVFLGFLQFFYDLDVDLGFDAAILIAAFLLSLSLGCLADRLLDWSCLCARCRTLETEDVR